MRRTLTRGWTRRWSHSPVALIDGPPGGGAKAGGAPAEGAPGSSARPAAAPGPRCLPRWRIGSARRASPHRMGPSPPRGLTEGARLASMRSPLVVCLAPELVVCSRLAWPAPTTVLRTCRSPNVAVTRSAAMREGRTGPFPRCVWPVIATPPEPVTEASSTCPLFAALRKSMSARGERQSRIDFQGFAILRGAGFLAVHGDAALKMGVMQERPGK